MHIFGNLCFKQHEEGKRCKVYIKVWEIPMVGQVCNSAKNIVMNVMNMYIRNRFKLSSSELPGWGGGGWIRVLNVHA